MKRRILSFITALALCLSLCPFTVTAAENTAERTTRTTPLNLTNEDAENAAEGWSWKKTDADGYYYTLTLDNVNFEVPDNSAITFSMDKLTWLGTITIVLIGENRVVSTHQSENAYNGCGIYLDSSSSRTPGEIVVSGSGSLTAEGWRCGISLGTGKLHFNGVTVNAQSAYPSGLMVTNSGSLLIENSRVSSNTISATGLTSSNSDISVVLRSVPAAWTYSDSLIAADSVNISGGSLTLAGSAERPAYNAIFNNRQTSIDLSNCQIDIRDVQYGLYVNAGTINLENVSGVVFCTAESIYNSSINNSNPAFSANTVNSSGCSIYAQTGSDILIYGDCSLPSEITELSVSGNLIIETGKTFTIGAGQRIAFSKNSAQICQGIDNTTLVNNGTLEFIYQPIFRSGTKLVNNGMLLAPKGISYSKTPGVTQNAQVTNTGTFNGIVTENSGFTQYIYGNVTLAGDRTLGVLNGSPWMIFKTFVMPGAVLTIPDGKTLDASQEGRGLTWESLSQYLSVGEGGEIVVEEGGTLLLPPNPTQEQINTFPVDGNGVIKFGEAVLCTVTFDSQGGSAVEKQNVLSGNPAAQPSVPTLDGYIFGGWYKEPGCENAWDFETGMVTAGTTLYAKWIQLPVESVTLDKSSLTLTVGDSQRLTATVTPSNAANKAVTWASSNPAVATVDSSGNVTAAGEGTATITVTTADGGKTANCTVTVTARSSETETKLEITEGIKEVPEGLKNIPELNTPAKLEAAMRTAITQTGVPSGNTAVYDVTLMISTDGGRTWAPAAKENFPSGGLTVTLPYPAGTNSSYTFTVVHMFTTSHFNKTPGDTETPRVTNTASGLQFTVTGLSPISVGWKQPSTPATPTGPTGGGGWSSSTYAVTVEKSEHGEVTSNRTNASSGDTVTLTVTPDGGYVLDTLAVTDSRGNEIGLTAQSTGRYTFTMPARSVTVMAAFAPLPDDTAPSCDGGTDCPSRRFTDLGAAGTWYHEAVDYVLRNGLMGGYGNGLFGPSNNLTRAQFAQILHNKDGKPAVAGGSIFADVASGAWCAPAITWAAARGIVGGYGGGLFGPEDNITREQLTVMLWRYAGSPAAAGKDLHFTDADKASGYALEALRWAVENGILNGYGNGRLGPRELVTRAQAAQMLKNFLEKSGLDGL